MAQTGCIEEAFGISRIFSYFDIMRSLNLRFKPIDVDFIAHNKV